MTPEQAIKVARHIAHQYRREADAVESEALYAYVLALKTWDPSKGASLSTYVYRRFQGAAREVLSKWRPEPLPVANFVRVREQDAPSEPGPMLRHLARLTTPRTAQAAWLYFGLDYTIGEAAEVMGIDESRVFQLITGLRKAFGLEPTKRHTHHCRSRVLRSL